MRSLARTVRTTREKGMKCVRARRDVTVDALLATSEPNRSSCDTFTRICPASPPPWLRWRDCIDARCTKVLRALLTLSSSP